MARRYFANFAPTQNLSGAITSGATSLSVPSFSGWPTSYPFTATLEYGTANAEIILVTNVAGTVATITRGYNGSTAVAHSAGATIDLTPVALDLDEANAHINANVGVHGVSGNVVGTSDVQTLTNKTLGGTTPTGPINATGNVTASGTVQGATVTATGQVNAATVVATGASTAASYTATGAVAGATASISGAASVGSLASTGAVTGSSFTASGNGAVAGVVKPKQYANEAAANTAGANVTGNVVHFTAPTTLLNPGPAFYDGTAWRSIAYDTGWTAATLGNSWTALGGAFATPSYRLMNGVVYLKGVMTGGTTATTVFTLPVGLRPSAQKVMSVFSNTGTARLDISSAGAVVVTAYQTGGGNASLSLDNISFPAEQ